MAVALPGCGGGGGDDERRSRNANTATSAPAHVREPIEFLATNSKMTTSGCTTRLVYRWKASDPADVPAGAEGVIKVKGKGVSGKYRRPVESGVVTLKLSTRVNRTSADFTARLLSVAGRPVTPDIPTVHPFLNTACGPNAHPQPPSSLPKGTPVPGAPCDPSAPPPPGLKRE